MTGATIARLWRYPVKSMGGEELTTLVVEPGGVTGDRGYAFFDQRRGRIASAPPLRRDGARVIPSRRRLTLAFRTGQP